MTYAVHFRIPFYITGYKLYIYGSYPCNRHPFPVKGSLVGVEETLGLCSNSFTAEVIETTHTSRLPHEYKWREVSYDVK